MKPILDESVKVLFRAKLIRVADVVIAAILLVSGGWIEVRVATGKFDVAEFIVTLHWMALLGLWGVLLLFRACYYVLQCRADVNMMGPTAARMVHAYLGGAPRPPPAPPP
jgi:hypothetical protein